MKALFMKRWFMKSLLTMTSLLLIGLVVYNQTGSEQVSKGKALELAPYQERDFQDEVFYFVLPDRFQNGDGTNDLGAAENDTKRALSRGGFDPADKGMYHGGDIAGLTEKLAYLDNMGVTAIWLTPILRNQAVQDNSSGYHGYWILDFSEIDPHLGSNAELKYFIDQAHKRNMKVFFDIITNHTADVIKYKECHTTDGASWLLDEKDCPYKSMEQVAKGDVYTPFIPAGNEDLKTPAWLNDVNVYHNQGDSDWEGESAIRGDFAGLDDIDTNSDKALNGMIDIYKDIIDEFKPDGFRIDTVKHVNMEFWQAFSPALIEHAKSQGIENFFMYAEVYSFEPEFLSRYTTTGKLQSVLDFALQNTLVKTLVEQQGTDVLAQLFAQDHLYLSDNQTDKTATQLVNFTGNHDMGRFAYFLKQSEQNYSETEQIKRNLLAHAIIYFSRGIPVIYYGDEQGFVGDGNDQNARQDMMPSKVATYNDDDLLATDKTTADDNFDQQHLFYQSFAKYAALYQQYPALRLGQQTTLYSQNAPGLFVIKRENVASNEKQTLMVAFNTSTQAQALAADINKQAVKLLYSSDIVVDGKIAPLSFAIYQMK